jgi:RimJ/RimL family protein N-acetyltransferase
MHFTKIKFEDLPFLNSLRNLYAQEFLHDSRIFNLIETQSWFHSTDPDYWIIWEGNERAGYFRLSNHSKENRNIYIGADLHPAFTGVGLGYKAYKQFIEFLFNDDEYDLHKITLEVLATNVRAIHLYKKLGFVQEGCKRQEILKVDTYVDSIIMSILKKDFKLHN